ncbi:MAG: hypothetical protein OHK0029_40010 [Armatimonadaceae bacterium]
MNRAITRSRVEEILSAFSRLTVLVVGDLMLDEHIWGAATRVSPEAPVLVVEALNETFVPGGAANTANQLLALGARVVVCGVVGKDAAGDRLLENLGTMGAETSAVIRADDRPTTQKTRIVAGNQQIVRVDREKREPLSAGAVADLIAAATPVVAGCNAVLFSDYAKGVLTPKTIAALTETARQHQITVTANPKPPTIRYYADVDVAQLNRSEADQASQSHQFDSTDEITFHDAGKRLRKTLGVRNLLVTRSGDGMTLFTEDEGYCDVPAHRVEVYDGTGAGDSTIAGLTLALAAGATLEEAVEIGNAAGGAVVRKVGVVAATREEITALFD